MINEINRMIEKSLRNMKIALDMNTGLLVYYYVMRNDNLTNLERVL
tara:strand:+ start:360 stop:497 length:138 start_codon:yes stop_codon:yes gene_type:complete